MERVVVKSAPSQLFHVCLGAQPFSGKPCHSENVVRPRRQVVTKARLDVASSATAKLCSRLPLTPFQPYPLRTPLGRRQTVCQASERDDADVTIGAQFVPHVEKPPFLSKAAELLKFRAFGGDEAAAGRMRRFSRVAIATLALAVLGGQAALASSPASAPAPPAPAASVGDAVPGDAAGGTMFDAKPSAGSRFAYELRRLLNQGVELAPEMSYSGLWHAIGQKEVKAVVFLPTNYHLLAVMSDGREQVVAYPPDPDLLRHLADNEVAIGGVLPNRWVNSIFGVLRATFPFVMLVTMSELYFRVDRKKAPKWVETEDISDLYSGEPPKNRLTAAWTKQKQANKRKSTKVTLNDIAGLDAIIDEIRELLYLMNNTQEVLALGVSKIPTGVLLVGRPGCGKTLLARAIAGETSRAFITAAGTQFTDMFIGSGASRVAALFAKARYYAPCTVFIDEFDAMAQQRGSSPARDAATAEKESTVNQLLVELDGFLERSDVVVLAATNRPSVLDKAVIRAGRFDKTIAIPPPDMIGREAILKVHARSKNMATDVDWREIAYRTGGMSGADLANLLNEAGFDAVRLNTKAITTTNVLNALDKVKDMFDDRDPAQAAMAAAAKAVAGGGSAAGKLSPSSSAPLEEDEPGATLTAADKRMLATYQAGKALLGVLHREFDDLSKVVVAPSGKAVGYTVFLPQEKYLTTAGHITKRYLEKQMVVALGGRCAEELLHGPECVSFGADDLKRASQIARESVLMAGFNEKIGPVALMEEKGDRFLSGDFKFVLSKMSPALLEVADAEVRSVLAQARATAMDALRRNQKILVRIVDSLCEKNTLTGTEVRAMVEAMGGQYFEEKEFELVFDEQGKRVSPIPENYGKPVGIGGDLDNFLRKIRLVSP